MRLIVAKINIDMESYNENLCLALKKCNFVFPYDGFSNFDGGRTEDESMYSGEAKCGEGNSRCAWREDKEGRVS